MKALQRVVWSLIFLVHIAEAEEPEISAQKKERKRPLSNSPSRPSMEEDALI